MIHNSEPQSFINLCTELDTDLLSKEDSSPES